MPQTSPMMWSILSLIILSSTMCFMVFFPTKTNKISSFNKIPTKPSSLKW